MAKYVYVYHGGSPPASPEEGAKVMAAWTKWIGDLGSKMVDVGNPTAASKTIAASGKVSDGGGANPISGYSIVEAPSLEEAVAWARSCPQLAAGGSIEVAETVNVM
jgi:hypothetical protein